MKRLLGIIAILVLATAFVFVPHPAQGQVSNSIQTARISWGVDAQPGVNTMGDALVEFVAPSNIRIVGSYIDAEVNNLSADWKVGAHQGRLALAANLSVYPLRSDLKFFNQTEAIVMVADTQDTVYTGINPIPTIIGNPYGQTVIMFPAGMGVDLQAGQKVYLHAGWENLFSQVHQMGISVIIYYVER